MSDTQQTEIEFAECVWSDDKNHPVDGPRYLVYVNDRPIEGWKPLTRAEALRDFDYCTSLHPGVRVEIRTADEAFEGLER